MFVKADRMIKNIRMFEDVSVDFIIMVDGAHEYEPVKMILLNWWPKLKSNGVMFGDDYN